MLPGLWNIGITIFLFIGFIIIIILFFVQLILLIRNKFRNKFRIVNILVLFAVILLTSFFPFGIYNFEKLESENILIAQREGVANCMTTLKLKENYNFIEKTVCFNVKRNKGKYSISGDTIRLEFDKKSSFGSKTAFAIIKLNNDSIIDRLDKLIYYRNIEDKNPISMNITKFELN